MLGGAIEQVTCYLAKKNPYHGSCSLLLFPLLILPVNPFRRVRPAQRGDARIDAEEYQDPVRQAEDTVLMVFNPTSRGRHVVYDSLFKKAHDFSCGMN
jgi:hypothetical protein